MFILEEPYISEFLLETLEENQFSILKNCVAENFSGQYKLNIKNEEEINYKDEKIYSNSENSIDWVVKNYKDTNLTKTIAACKDKCLFREKIKKIYPNFFFRKVSAEELDKIDVSNFPEQFIIKPCVGFLSMGVHKVLSPEKWAEVVQLIKKDIENFEKLFPKEVLNSSNFLIEEMIKGEEFAIDVYSNSRGEPVILNIFKHPFADKNDVSDRLYITSKEIIEENLETFKDKLSQIFKALNIKDFPMHIEVIKRKNGDVIPVEINPMRFAGWCTTDLAYFAYKINIYEYFANNKEPDWNKILENKGREIYYFAMAQMPEGIEPSKIKFDYQKLKANFKKILDFRKINYLEKPMFAIVFGEAQDESEINKILKLDIKPFCSKI